VIIVVSGPGGVGKGTVVQRLVEQDPRLWLSRSWTTRAQRPGEAEDAYHYVDDDAFQARVAADGFLEHAQFLGERYGTPIPDDLPEGLDLVLEIDVQGAAQVLERAADALLVLLVAPSREAQAERLRGRGDPEDAVQRRLAKGDEEVARGRELGATVVVNDDLDRAVAELAQIIGRARRDSQAGS
jgi:guanylate kinase